MKIFIIGGRSNGARGEERVLTKFCRDLGKRLGDSEHQVILCSCHDKSADFFVLEGLKKSAGRVKPSKLIVHRPDDTQTRKEWKDVTRRFGLASPVFHDHRGPDFRTRDDAANKASRPLAFLLCQIRALDECDAIIAVGGANNGSAVMLLRIAREKGHVILPFRFLSGAAERTFTEVEGDLKARLENSDVEKLSDAEDGVAAALDLVERLSGARIRGPIRIFLSYPWARSDLADLVEAMLRRHDHISVFRDERDVRQVSASTIELQTKFLRNVTSFWHCGAASMFKVRIAMTK